jgi:tetratricopeptide (TPR) repeat protein
MADTSQSLEFQQGSEDVKNRIYSECIAKYIQTFQENLKQQKRQLRSQADAGCSGNAPENSLITACTELIDSGDEPPRKLARDYFWRGAEYCVQDKTDVGIPDFIESIRLDPAQRNSYNYLDKIYIDRDQYDDAIKNANMAILNDPKNSIAYRQRGLAFVLGSHDLDRAFADLDIAVKLDPNDALEMRGIVEKKLGRVADGERDIAKAHTMKPNHTVFR